VLASNAGATTTSDDYERVKTELIDVEGVIPARYWPPELYEGFRGP